MDFRLWKHLCISALFLLGFWGCAEAQADVAKPAASVAASLAPSSVTGPTGIDLKRPLFAGACKGCPWGVLASVVKDALKPAGYDVQICWVCWSVYGPREMADRTKPVIPAEINNVPKAYVEQPPNAVPDISATSAVNLIAAWNGTGPYAKDHRPRRNYRVIAALQQPNFLMIAANRKSGITDLAQVKSRTKPTWIAIVNRDAAIDEVLAYYGITEAGLKAHGGGVIHTTDRHRRAAADLFIGGALLVDTPEQRIWYQVSQLDDLRFFEMPAPLLDKLAKLPGYERVTAPLALLRGVDRPIPTVMRAAHYIYVRDDAPDSFSYAVAKALDEHQALFSLHGDPFYYNVRLVADSPVIPMAPGALKYYRERGYVH
ncbi:MAG TPA: TAXI family TRAP transporter solute-binding subunit [Stellaceae bacterium]|nr:TAXI family TRAP transporter solute-binding subunit [Stellaceae bacterium]